MAERREGGRIAATTVARARRPGLLGDTVERREVVIAGGGFGGSVLGRALHAQGRDVLLLERGRHPRFALGESSTPLANLALERLAMRYGFDDLWTLAAHGRWRRRLPEVGRGLKRGFCFYSHRPGRAFVRDTAGSGRLVVAASPDEEAADNQWLRADVDRFLFERARSEGVDCREETAVEVLSTPDEPEAGPVRIRAGDRLVEAGLLVDATGGSPLAGRLGARSLRPRLQTTLVYSHFDGVASFDRGDDWPDSPFPERWSAAHHLLEEGWMYQLAFDDASVSAGVLLPEDRPAAAAAIEELAGGGADASGAEAVFAGLLARYPSLASQFAGHRPLRDLAARSGVAYRRDRAAGPGWLLLPHSYAFADPMFSTGIAWSLLAVERIADLCRRGLPAPAEVERYGRLLAAEADHIDRLLVAAYRLMNDFEGFTAAAMAYFAAASFDELRQRLLDPPKGGWCWLGFLGADEEVRGRLFEELDERSADPVTAGGLAGRIGPAIEARNLIGLDDPSRRNVYPVDLAAMARRQDRIAARLGVELDVVRRRWPRLRSPDRMP
ncbi:MAG: tryptophan 7-halogenase [Acidobacteria bacterium]|nr:tryptophan 7-halogenase [Acidobacteriota bacterium]